MILSLGLRQIESMLIRLYVVRFSIHCKQQARSLGMVFDCTVLNLLFYEQDLSVYMIA